MLNTKENFKQLDATLAVKELDNETAATIQGGWDLIGYDLPDGKGKPIAWANSRIPRLTSSNNRISSVKINKGQWKFYDGFDYKGASEGPIVPAYSGQIWNLNRFSNKTSSLRDLTG